VPARLTRRRGADGARGGSEVTGRASVGWDE